MLRSATTSLPSLRFSSPPRWWLERQASSLSSCGMSSVPVSEARLAAVLSKRGWPDWGDPKACRALVRALVTDSVEDLEASSLCLSPSLCERGNRQKERAGIPAKFQVLLARAAPHKMNLTARCFCSFKANERQLFEDLPITHRCEFLGPVREAAKATIKVYSMRPC